MHLFSSIVLTVAYITAAATAAASTSTRSTGHPEAQMRVTDVHRGHYTLFATDDAISNAGPLVINEDDFTEIKAYDQLKTARLEVQFADAQSNIDCEISSADDSFVPRRLIPASTTGRGENTLAWHVSPPAFVTGIKCTRKARWRLELV
jgi:hypothetical protein